MIIGKYNNSNNIDKEELSGTPGCYKTNIEWVK